jgi:hypothetical protein
MERSRDGQREILIVKIPAGEFCAGRWTFPNRAVEVGQSPEAAIRQLVLEGLGTATQIVYGQPPFDQPWQEVMTRWRVFFCEGTAGPINNRQYEDTRWIPRAALREYEFDPVSQQIVDWLLEDSR